MEGFRFVYNFILNRFGNKMKCGYKFIPQGVTASFGQSPSWEVTSCCGGQEIHRLLCKSKVATSVHTVPCVNVLKCPIIILHVVLFNLGI
jgi:hypothetical protein